MDTKDSLSASVLMIEQLEWGNKGLAGHAGTCLVHGHSFEAIGRVPVHGVLLTIDVTIYS